MKFKITINYVLVDELSSDDWVDNPLCAGYYQSVSSIVMIDSDDNVIKRLNTAENLPSFPIRIYRLTDASSQN